MLASKPISILLAEDNDDDLFLMQKALKKGQIEQTPMTVRDGAESIDYLAGQGAYSDRARFPFPSLFFLDLKMPIKGGFEVMEWWRSEPRQHHLTIVVLSSSVHSGDIKRAYSLGAASYLCKPSQLQDLVEMVARTLNYWCIVERPE